MLIGEFRARKTPVASRVTTPTCPAKASKNNDLAVQTPPSSHSFVVLLPLAERAKCLHHRSHTFFGATFGPIYLTATMARSQQCYSSQERAQIPEQHERSRLNRMNLMLPGDLPHSHDAQQPSNPTFALKAPLCRFRLFCSWLCRFLTPGKTRRTNLRTGPHFSGPVLHTRDKVSA